MMSSNKRLASTAHATFLIVAPLWAIVTYPHFPPATGLIVILIAVLSWGAATGRWKHLIHTSPWFTGAVAAMGALVGVVAVEGYDDTAQEMAGEPVAGEVSALLAQHDWATAAGITVVIFFGCLVLLPVVGDESKRPSPTPAENESNPSQGQESATMTTAVPDPEHQWTIHGERDLYQSTWVRLSLVDVQPPTGPRFEHHVITMKPAAMVALLSQDRRHVGLIWRHRFAPDLWNWELPGGLVDEGEDPAATALREVTEETGLTVEPSSLRHLVTFEPNTGMVRAPHHVYSATAHADSGTQPTELNEGSGLQWIALSSIQERITTGQILNSGTLVALLHLLAFGTE